MKGIRQMGTGIGRQLTGVTSTGYFHFAKRGQYVRGCIGTAQFLFQNTEDQERNETEFKEALENVLSGSLRT